MPLTEPVYITCRKVHVQGGVTGRVLRITSSSGVTLSLDDQSDGMGLGFSVDPAGVSHAGLANVGWEDAGHTVGNSLVTGGFTSVAGWNGNEPVSVDANSLAGGGTSVESFQARFQGSQDVTTAFVQVANWQASDVSTSPGLFVWDEVAGTLTVTQAALLELSAWGLVTVTGNNRVELAIEVTSNGVRVGDAFDRQYSARNSTQDQGSAQVSGYLYACSANEVLAVRVLRVGATCDLVNARLSVKAFL